MNPSRVARNVAFDSVPPVIWFQASCLAAGSGNAARQAAACLAKADPQADVLINLHCAACQHPWQVALEIECFLWAKLNALAKRLLREVHVLAQTYGWRETDILAMSAVRRQIYLEMIRS